MKKSLFIIPFLLLFFSAFGQQEGIWLPVSESAVPGQRIEKAFTTDSRVIFRLDFNRLRTTLEAAPMRGDLQKQQGLILEFPTADGTLERFSVVEAPTLHPDLSARYGGIQSFAGQGIDDPTATIRFSVSQLGFNGMIRSGNKSTCFIDPFTKDKSHYMVYARKDISGITRDFTCYTENDARPSSVTGEEKATDDKRLRKYRLALSCTAEYGNIFAGTGTTAQKKANILAQMNITMTRVNGVYEQDLAITMEIIPNNDAIIYFGSTTADPWSNEWNNTTQTTIDNIIGDANYDIGHNFNTTGGGNAGCIGCVCTSGSKGSGYTGRSNPTGDAFDIDYVAHEMGHQFGGYHVQSNSSCRSGSGTTEVEPGSGSSIMGYAGICAANVQSNSDDYFNYVNIRDISANVQSGTSSGCAQIINLSNNPPTANAGANYTIPKSTAFVLRGSGSDPDGNGSLTYTWEENDPENPNSNSAPSSTRTQGPMFRSIKGTASPDRYMPKISDVVAGNLTPTWEVVPSVGRTLDFALTVRDNNAGGGQTADDLMTVTVSGSAGPFVVNAPNTNVVWNVGSSQTVTWSVANTNTAPVSCANVNILLSTDGGYTYPVTILANTPNDGSQVVTVPNNISTTCRVKVEAADNIFYDISNTNFSIEGAVQCTATTPTGLAASNITSNSVTLSWNAVPGATYDVRHRPTGGSWTTISGIAGTSTTITGLNPTTSYEAQVRSVCSGGSTSAYSGSVTYTTTAVQLNYCTSQGNNVNDEYIGRVQLNTIDNSSGAAGYSDHTGISTDLASGTAYTITITPVWTGTVYNEAYAVWIDYNQDGDFADAGEQVWTKSASQTTPVSGTFTVPASAALGNTRMRVSMKYNGIPTACETFTYGEVEDYTVNITTATCPPAGTACDDGDPSTFNDVEDGNCNCSGTPCPAAGTACDDGDPSTFNDVEDGNCNCSGTPCPAAGTACDDGDPSTFNDVEDGNCNCSGTPCPAAGTACDDGDPSTFNDVEDGNCNCSGTPCPAAGTACDDGNPNTINDVEDGNCNCAGTPVTTCTDVTLSLTFDNYPEETSWTLKDANNATIASGGTYPNQPDGSTITQTFCLEDGCYDFTINDAYGDGICCSYGNGSYSLTDVNGTTLASGGSFTSSETTNFCIGAGPAPTCNDGIQNGQETGIDCGGPDCPACVLNYCSSQGNNASEEYIGRVQLNTIDNSSGSAGYTDFTAVSTNLSAGTAYTITVTPIWPGTKYREAYAVWIDYNHDGDFADAGERVWSKSPSKTSPVSGSFTVPSTAKNGATRMRVSLKYNAIPTPCETFSYGEVEDYTVVISGGAARPGEEAVLTTIPEDYKWKFFPNPAGNHLVIDIAKDNAMAYTIQDITGRTVLSGKVENAGKQKIDISHIQNGYYLLSITFKDGKVLTKQFVKGL